MTRKLLLLLVAVVTIGSLSAQTNKPVTDQDIAAIAREFLATIE